MYPTISVDSWAGEWRLTGTISGAPRDAPAANVDYTGPLPPKSYTDLSYDMYVLVSGLGFLILMFG
jgi:hypothetical protein